MSPIYDINSRTKPHLNVGTIGDRASGKTTLTAAITKFLANKGLAQELAIDQIDKEKEEKIRCMTIDCNIVEYTTEKRHYAHVDCPGDVEYADNMAKGASLVDCAILVVDVEKGLTANMRAHITLALQAGVDDFVVFVNKCDSADEEELSSRQFFLEADLRDMLQGYKRWADLPMVFGSAQRALEGDSKAMEKIASLMAALDESPDPSRKVDSRFHMQVLKVLTITGKGTVATGRVAAGKITAGDGVDILGLRDKTTAVVTEVQSFGCQLEMGMAGDFVGLMLGDLKHDGVLRGQTICAPDSATTHQLFEMEGYALEAKEGGREQPFSRGYSPQFLFGTAEVTGVFASPITEQSGGEKKMVRPGENLVATIELKAPLALMANTRFAIREGNVTVAAGIISKILR